MEESVIVLSSSSDYEDERLREAKKRKWSSMNDGVGVRSAKLVKSCAEHEFKVLSDLTGFQNLAAMMAAEAFMRRRKRKKRKKKKKNGMTVDFEKKGVQENTAKDVETTRVVETETVPISENVMPQKLVVDASKPEMQADTFKDVETSKKIEIDVAKGQQADTVVAIGTTKALETSSIPVTQLLPQKLFRGPRYFDPPENSLGMCCHCGEESHPPVNCTVKKRKKPCFFCGDIGHNGKKCKQGRDCFFCKGIGHIAKDCPEKHLPKVCLRCGDSGHDMWSCNTDYSPDDLKEIQCYVCKSFGHLCCLDIPDKGTSQVSCYNCGLSGHLGSGCTKLHGNASGSRSPAKCFRCGEEGHVSRRCKKHVKAEKTAGNLLTPQKFPKEERDFLGSKSAPQDLCKAQKESLYEERDCMVARQLQRDGWIADRPGNLFCGEGRGNVWMSPSAPGHFSSRQPWRDVWIADQPGNLFCGEARGNVWMSPSALGHFSSPQYPYEIFNHHPPSTSSQAYQPRFQTSGFFNFSSG